MTIESKCLHCGSTVRAEEPVPAVDDDAAWDAIWSQHASDCEWARTRAFRLRTDLPDSAVAMVPDDRKWRIISDYVANDPEPYTTQQLMDYTAQCNVENAGYPDWTPFELQDRGDLIVDVAHQRGNDGYVVAEPWDDD